jgi:protein-tyrosine-phosphatase
MAEAFFNKMSNGHRAISCGTMSREKGLEGKKVGNERPNTAKVMKSFGYDISKKTSKEITKERIYAADIIIYMRDKPTTPPLSHKNKKVVFWDDLPFQDTRSYGYIYSLAEVIKKKVEKLVIELEKNGRPKNTGNFDLLQKQYATKIEKLSNKKAEAERY